MNAPETAARPAPAEPKLPSDSLVLRAPRGKAMRYRRSVIVTIVALGSIALAGLGWIALKPTIIHRMTAATDLSKPSARPGDTLSKLPVGYGDVPRLGMPLPGDLGPPILRAQQRRYTMGGVEADADKGAAEAARLSQAKSARESPLLVQVSARDHGPAPVAVAAEPQATASFSPDAPPAPADHKLAFAEQRESGPDINSAPLQPPASPYLLTSGSIIAASLLTGLNSDLPGLVMAQVTQNVFDSVTGRILLVPQGSRLIGKYDATVSFGQRRALVIWQRLMLPDGRSMRLDNFPATDASGYAGLADKVNSHGWALLKGAAISTLLGVGSELSLDGESDLVEAIRQSAQQTVSRAGDQLVAHSLDIQPTIMIRPGTPVRLLVVRDLVLAPWRAPAGE